MDVCLSQLVVNLRRRISTSLDATPVFRHPERLIRGLKPLLAQGQTGDTWGTSSSSEDWPKETLGKFWWEDEAFTSGAFVSVQHETILADQK